MKRELEALNRGPLRGQQLVLCRWLEIVILLALVLFNAGCESATQDATGLDTNTSDWSEAATSIGNTSAGEAEPTTSGDGQTSSLPGNNAGRVEEAWEVLFIDGKRVGQAHFVRELLAGNQVEIASTSETNMLRFGQAVQLTVSQISVETTDGQLLRCSSKMTQGPVVIETAGHVQSGQLVLETKTLGKSQSDVLVWDLAWGGYFVDQESFRRKPMQPGEKRTLRGLFAQFNKLGEFRLHATQHEIVKLLSGEAKLLRIEASIQVEDTQIDTVYWTDPEGRALKSTVAFSGLPPVVVFRTTKQVALADTGPAQFDLGQQTIVTTDRPLDAPHRTQRVVYAVRLRNGDPAKTFVSGPSQVVQAIDEHNAKITVLALRGDQAISTAADNAATGSPPTDADLAPNNLIQSDDSVIVSMARQVSVASQDPWALACALERYVQDTVSTKDFSQAMASAADVARSREGDCTEHAVLLAALCRARQIPARVAIGLVYYRQAGGFAYHMWNEVWIGGRWIAIDGTLGAGGIGAGHLKINHSNLAGTSPFSALLPVLQVLGEMELQILDVE